MIKDIEMIIEELEHEDQRLHQLREKADRVIKVCGKAMQKIHVGDYDSAEKMLDEINIKPLLDEDVGTVAIQEYVEGKLLLEVMKEGKIPDKDTLRVPTKAYLLGIADLIGELRREITSHLIKDDYGSAIKLFNIMNKIYIDLLPIRVSNSVLPGFRRKMDVARGILEQSRRDILSYKIHKG